MRTTRGAPSSRTNGTRRARGPARELAYKKVKLKDSDTSSKEAGTVEDSSLEINKGIFGAFYDSVWVRAVGVEGEGVLVISCLFAFPLSLWIRSIEFAMVYCGREWTNHKFFTHHLTHHGGTEMKRLGEFFFADNNILQ